MLVLIIPLNLKERFSRGEVVGALSSLVGGSEVSVNTVKVQPGGPRPGSNGHLTAGVVGGEEVTRVSLGKRGNESGDFSLEVVSGRVDITADDPDDIVKVFVAGADIGTPALQIGGGSILDLGTPALVTAVIAEVEGVEQDRDAFLGGAVYDIIGVGEVRLVRSSKSSGIKGGSP